MQKRNAFRRTLLIVLCLCLLAGTVFADDPQPSACDHDYTLAAYEAPRYRAPGFERYRCTKCGDEYEIELPQLVERAPNWSYDSLSNATSDHLTIFVGYYGMSYTQKITLPLRDIVNNCPMVQQTFSYINRRPRVCYAVGYGPLLDDVLAYAGVDIYSIQALQFGTADSGDAFYNQQEWTHSSLYASRYFFPELSVYFQEDGSIRDSYAAGEGAERVRPMLAVWSSWLTYGIGEEFTASNHEAMSTDNCFRLLYGQSWVGEQAASTSAKWCNAIYVRYAGAPTLDAGDDLHLSVEKDKSGYQLHASVSTVDARLTELFSAAVTWSSSDESVVRVDRKTGKVTVVGEGTATITATAKVGDIVTTDTLTVTVSKDSENTGDGGTGGGTGSGSGSGTGGSSGPSGGKADQPGTGGEAGGKSDHPGESTAPGESDGKTPSGSEAPSQATPDGSGTEPSLPSSERHLQFLPGSSAQQPSQPQQTVPHGTLRRIQTGDSAAEPGGSSGGGMDVSLLLQSPRLLLLTALAALLLLLLGGGLKYLQYRKQMK